MKTKWIRYLLVCCLILGMGFGLNGCATNGTKTQATPQPETDMSKETVSSEPISKPGTYEGYSSVLYDGYELTSRYMEVRDGTKIVSNTRRIMRDIPFMVGEVADERLASAVRFLPVFSVTTVRRLGLFYADHSQPSA